MGQANSVTKRQRESNTRDSRGNNAGLLSGKDKAIWRRTKGTQALNTQGAGKQLDTDETHQGGESIAHT